MSESEKTEENEVQQAPKEPGRLTRLLMWFRRNLKKFAFMAWGAIAVAMLLWIPMPIYYLALLPVFIGILHFLLSKLIPVEVVIAHDFENGEINVTAMSAHSMYDYRKIDADGEASDILYWFKGAKAKVAIVDKLDDSTRTMVINPISSSVEFIKDYRMAMMELRKLANQLSNSIVKLSHEMELRTIFKAYQIFKDSGALNMVVQSKPKMPGYQTKISKSNMDAGSETDDGYKS